MIIFLQKTKQNSLQGEIQCVIAEPAKAVPRTWCAVVFIFNDLLIYL